MEPITTVVVQRDEPRPSYIDTPLGVPDIVVRLMSPVSVVMIRGLRVFLQTLVGLMTAGSTGYGAGVIRAADFVDLLSICASLAVAPAAICMLQNTLELLARVDETNPQFRP